MHFKKVLCYCRGRESWQVEVSTVDGRERNVDLLFIAESAIKVLNGHLFHRRARFSSHYY